VAAAVAYGAPATIIGTGANTFDAPTYTINQGDTSSLQIQGGTHNATANQTGPDGKALFRSSTISSGSTPVRGTEYLTTGSYPFICTVHPTTMQATLNVSTTGTPKPRPALLLKLVSRKIAKVVKKRTLVVQVTPNSAVSDATIEAKLGKTSLAKLTGLSLPAGAQNVKLKLSKKAKAKLARKKKATIALSGSVPFGAPTTATGKLK
jgi:plastocyanin